MREIGAQLIRSSAERVKLGYSRQGEAVDTWRQKNWFAWCLQIFITVDDILNSMEFDHFRRWTPEGSATRVQLINPPTRLSNVLERGHDGISGGNLSIEKTLEKVLQNYDVNAVERRICLVVHLEESPNQHVERWNRKVIKQPQNASISQLQNSSAENMTKYIKASSNSKDVVRKAHEKSSID